MHHGIGFVGEYNKLEERAVIEEGMAHNFLELMKDMNPYFAEA